MSTTILLVRHADSQRPRPGGPDEFHRPLTDEGVRQAQHLLEDLTAFRPTVVVSSPYLRAIQTVQPVAEHHRLPIESNHELREWDSGLAPTPGYERFYAESWSNPVSSRPNGESLQQLTLRATTALAALHEQHSGQTVIAASHGTFISRALLGLGAAGIDWPFSTRMPMPAVYRIAFHRDHIDIAGPGL